MTERKDERLNPVDNKSCGICIANGLTICQGHGSSDAGENKTATADLSAASNQTIPKTLYTSFLESQLWSQDEEELIFTWHNADSIMSITADIGTGTITISSIDDVSDAQGKARDELLVAIENEFIEFKKELAGIGISVDGMRAIHTGNELKIIIPNKPVYYDAFMQRLIVKNLLITQLVAKRENVDPSRGLAEVKSIAPREPMFALEEVQRINNIPGIATAIISDKGVVTTQSVGVTNANNPLGVTDSTVFEAASLSKPVFGYLVLKLAQAGKIDLDRPLHEYADFGPPPMREHVNYKKLTARMILSHQAGLPNEFNPPEIPLDYVSPAGEKFDYSGEAYRFLGEVVENVSSKSLETLAQEAFTEIGMTNTSFMPPTGCSLIRLRDDQVPTSETVKKLLENESDQHGQLSIIYHKDRLFVADRAADGNVQITEKNSSQVGKLAFQAMRERFASIPPFFWSKPIPIEARELALATTIVGHPPEHATTLAIGHYQDGSVNPNQRFYGVHPAGSLYTTTSDYAKFLNACTSDPYIREEMFKPTVTALTDKDTKAIKKGVSPDILEQMSWGVGIGLQTNSDGSRVAFHWGDNGTGRNLAAINLTTGESIVCLTNSANGPAAFRAIAEPVVGDLSPISQWLSKREGLPMEEKVNPAQDIRQRLQGQKPTSTIDDKTFSKK